MPAYFVDRANFTPSLTDDIYVLNAGNNHFTITSVGWGGRATSSSAYRTRWYRAITPPGTLSATFFAQKASPGATLNTVAVNTFFTPAVPPAEPAGCFVVDWNAFNGNGYVVFADPIWMGGDVGDALHTRFFCCRNSQGVDPNATHYWTAWEE